MMNRKAASGVDGESTEQFASEMEERVEEICRQLKAGAYRAPPVRRVEIPKGPGKSGTRPLGIPTVADRCCSERSRAYSRPCSKPTSSTAVSVLTGSQPSRLAGLSAASRDWEGEPRIETDIRSYFTRIDHQWLRRMVAHRIADPIILRLISKWLKAGALRDRVFIAAEEGTPQGGPISPCSVTSICTLRPICGLRRNSNHSVWRGVLVRFADDFVGCFQFQDDAQNFQRQLRERFARFTGAGRGQDCCCSFGRFAAAMRGRRGLRPETFRFSASNMSVGWIEGGALP